MPGRTGAVGPDDDSTASCEVRGRSAAWVWHGVPATLRGVDEPGALWTDRPAVAASSWSPMRLAESAGPDGWAAGPWACCRQPRRGGHSKDQTVTALITQRSRTDSMINLLEASRIQSLKLPPPYAAKLRQPNDQLMRQPPGAVNSSPTLAPRPAAPEDSRLEARGGGHRDGRRRLDALWPGLLSLRLHRHRRHWIVSITNQRTWKHTS
jgi:hypothetical protein